MLAYDKVVLRPIFSYELPMNKVVQALKKNTKIEETWKTVDTFISSCTTTDIYQPETITLQIDSHASRDTTKLKEDMTRRFGKCNSHFDGLFTIHRWQLEAIHLDTIIEYLTALQPIPKDNNLRPYISLRLDYSFEFIDPQTREILKNQDEQSCLAIFMEKSSNAMAEFWFPFSTVEELSAYISKIKDYLPFRKLDTKAFRIVYPNKQGTKNVIRKIEF